MKKIVLLTLVISFNLLVGDSIAQNAPGTGTTGISIIPQPLHLKTLSGKFIISSGTRIVVDNNNQDLRTIAQQLSKSLEETAGVKLPVISATSGSVKNAIVLTLKSASDTLGTEGYDLSVNSGGVVIKASNPHGVFYGVQSLNQLLPVNINKNLKTVSIPAVQITDKPRFEWRGLMLDVGRYFYSVDFIKKYIDYLAMHKMNTFHWHLTEDHGWRIEIKKYPRLTEIGAWRAGTQFSRFPGHVDKNPHGGYYTQDQIREVVAYAQKKFVNVIPEIEMPGHTLAALVAYPELSCTGGPFKMPVNWAIQKDIYCAGNDKTFTFLQDVLTEVTDLFPSKIIHIGGDEAPKDRWKACPKCQARIKAEGLKDEHELQSYFIKRIENFLLTKNRNIIGWDEILEGGLAPNAAVMSWRGIKGGIAAAKQHHDVVMSPNDHMYFDYYQGEPYIEPTAIAGLLTLEKVYSYEPVPSELNATEAKYIKGVQGNVWGEYIHSPEKAEIFTFPRAAALSEVAWSAPNLKNWPDFQRRMETQYKRYDAQNIRYSKAAYNVWVTSEIDSLKGKATVTLKNQGYNTQIKYTLDGSEPTAASLNYSAPINVTLPVTIRTASFKNGARISEVSRRTVVILPIEARQ